MMRDNYSMLDGSGNLKNNIKIQNTLIGFFVFVLAIGFVVSGYLLAQEINPRKNYSKKHLFDLKVDKGPVESVFADAEENYYVLLPEEIEVFNNTGKLVRKIAWKNPNSKIKYEIHVDDDGNILISGASDSNPTLILDKNGKEISSFKFAGRYQLGFSNGVMYRVTDGKVLHRLSTAKKAPKQKMFFKDFDEVYDTEKNHREALEQLYNPKHLYHPKRFIHLPSKVGKFRAEGGILTITNDGTSFAFYATSPVIKPGYTFENPYQIRELFKFDPSYDLVGVIQTSGRPFVNLETGKVYEFKYDSQKNLEEIYRWDKTN